VLKFDALFSAPWTDAGGVEHDPRQHARRGRIVSVVPSMTETLCELGGRERLVGCTAFCVHPRGLLKEPAIAKIGGTKTILRDKILALEPDLLLLNLEENSLEDIDFFRTRVECYINGSRTLEDGLRMIAEMASLIGLRQPATELLAYADGVMTNAAALRDAALKGRPRPRMAYMIWREPWMTVNRDTFIHNMLEFCGVENVFAGLEDRYPTIALQDVVDSGAEIVWLPSEPFRFKEKHLAEFVNLKGLRAAQNGRVELIDGEAVCWFGVRQINGTLYTARTLWKNAGTPESS
jgi:iron complex transport system substrate-binding protein